MYQLSMSIGTEYTHWFKSMEENLKTRLGATALVVTRIEPTRLYLAVACETSAKRRAAAAVSDALCDVFAVDAKRDYYKENLALPLLAPEKYNILLAALVEFDSAADRELIKSAYAVENGLNIDGVYNFSFSEIKSRWRDIGELTRENAVFLADNEIFFELIKYLFSAITPKTEKVSCVYNGGKYTLFDCTRGQPIKEVFSEEDLLCTLIGIAPVCLELSGERFDKNVHQKLNVIFNAQSPLKCKM